MNNSRRPNGKKFGRNFKKDEDKQFEEKVIKISKVTKVVKGGKRMRFSALVVIGDNKGKFGYGAGKSGEVPEAIKKGISKARKNLSKLSVAKGDTITHEVMGTFGATKVFLKPAPEGTGLIAGGAVRAILELAGIKNIYSKIYGSRTQANVVKATFNALSLLKTYPQVKATRFNIVEEKKEETKPVEAK